VLGPKTGEMLWGYVRGIDDRKLEPHKERKSISAEMNVSLLSRTATLTLVWYPLPDPGTGGDMCCGPCGGGVEADEACQRSWSTLDAQGHVAPSRCARRAAQGVSPCLEVRLVLMAVSRTWMVRDVQQVCANR
jgi:DNA repair protein REV1